MLWEEILQLKLVNVPNLTSPIYPIYQRPQFYLGSGESLRVSDGTRSRFLGTVNRWVGERVEWRPVASLPGRVTTLHCTYTVQVTLEHTTTYWDIQEEITTA